MTSADVIIIGSGISGSMLAAILAKRGLDVLIVDSGTHPRFSIGEATTPDTSCKFKLLAKKYEVPEIANLATFYKLRDHVNPSCGIKRSFSFLYHREHTVQNPKESHQFPTLSPPFGPDCHFFRQDTDAYMMSIAVQYGARVKPKVNFEKTSFAAEGVEFTDAKGEKYSCKYVVDSSGFSSFLANQLDLRDDPEKMKTNSRAIFTHMTGVAHYDMMVDNPKDYELKYPLSQSTLHHIFEGGWFWIIPFDNHKDAVNPLCSVGLLLNRELYPATGMDPETEFYTIVDKFPQIKEQLQRAKSVREWVGTGRVQYQSKKIIGDRYCLSAQAAGFVDPLFSSGLNLTSSVIDLLAENLIKAFKDNDFSTERFENIDHFFQKSLQHYDEVVSSAFVSFRDYDLWDAWFRVWVAGNFVGTALNTNMYLKHKTTKKQDYLEMNKVQPYSGVLGNEFHPHRELFGSALIEMDAVRNSQKTPKAAATIIRRLFKDVKYIPAYYKWHNKNNRTTPTFTFFQGVKLYYWYYFFAPKSIRNHLFGWNILTVVKWIFSSIFENYRHSRRRARFYLRDVFWAWNKDWKSSP